MRANMVTLIAIKSLVGLLIESFDGSIPLASNSNSILEG
jgi:hypothetical protein